MKRENLLSICVVLLLLLNFGILGYLFLQTHHGLPPPRIDHKIIETLGWNNEQQVRFEKLKHLHRVTMNQLDGQFEEAARKYFSLLKTPSVDTAQKNLLEKGMAEIERQKADITFHHFEDLRRVCTPEQVKKFSSLIPELIEILIAPHPKNGPQPLRRG